MRKKGWIFAGLPLFSMSCGPGEAPFSKGGEAVTGGSQQGGSAASGGTVGGESASGAATAAGGRESSGGAPQDGGASVGGSSGSVRSGGGGAGGSNSTAGSSPGGGEDSGGMSPVSTGGATGTPGPCTFEIATTLSQAIPTVGIVDWSTNLPGVTAARIEFTLNDPLEGERNLGSGGPISVSESKAFLLGLKPERSYTYRIVATAGETECVSADQTIVTEAHTKHVPVDLTLGASAALRASGFVVTCGYSFNQALIIDTDGAVVWQTEFPSQCSRAHMDWSGDSMWMMHANPSLGVAGGTLGHVTRIRMDGSQIEDLEGLTRAHHDFAVAPEGLAAFLVVDDETGYTEIVERTADGTLTALVRLDNDGYQRTSGQYHPNALRYDPRDDTYTVSDLDIATIAKFDRQGQLKWTISGSSLAGTHGHHLLDNGNILSFSANIGTGSIDQPSPVSEFSRTEPGLNLEWSYVDEYRSLTFGDVQRLPNGNTWITYSNDGVLVEVTPEKELAQTLVFEGHEVGYSTFRETLYGPPPR